MTQTNKIAVNNTRVLKSLIVSHSAELGGAELFLVDLAGSPGLRMDACFLSNGDAATLLAAEGINVRVLEAPSALLSLRRQTSIWRSGLSVIALLHISIRLSSILREYDIVFANSQKSLFVAGLASFLARRPLVWILHDIMSSPSFGRANRELAIFFANRFAKIVVVNSKATLSAFREVGGRTASARVIYNGFQASKAIIANKEAALRLRSLFGFDERPVLGLFARIARWKGQHILIEALAKLPDVQALIVGGPLFGTNDYEHQIKQLAVALNVSDRIRFAGFRKDIPELLAGVDVVVHTSIEPEPFGRIVVEGLFAGQPVIATRGGGIDEILTDGVNGLLVAPGDPEDLSKALRKVICNRELARKLGEAGLRTSDRFRIENTIEQFKRLIKELTEEPSDAT